VIFCNISDVLSYTLVITCLPDTNLGYINIFHPF